MAETLTVNVRIAFGHTIFDARNEKVTINIASDGSDTILQVKEKIAATKGGRLTAEHIFLTFGPNDKFLGRQYQGDPNVNDAALTLAPFSVLTWLKQFPSWTLTARLMPAAPPPPGVAIKKAAALAEGKDPDKEVAIARMKGELLKESQLPAPWGPKAHKIEKAVTDKYQPVLYSATIAT